MSEKDITGLIDFLKNPSNYYFSKQSDLIKAIGVPRSLNVDDMYFVKMRSITFEEDAPRQEALANVLSAMRIPCINFVYLIIGDKRQVSFYYGVTKDLYAQENKTPQNLKEIGGELLSKGVVGNFRGSSIEVVDEPNKHQLLQSLNAFKELCVLEGVPGLNEDDGMDFQGVDRLVDVMLGDEFAFLVTAKWLPIGKVVQLEDEIYSLYENLAPSAKSTIQKSKSEGVSTNFSETKGTNNSDASAKQQSEQIGTSESQTTGHNRGNRYDDDSTSTSKSGSENKSSTVGVSNTRTEGRSESRSDSKGTNQGKSLSNSTEYVRKDVSEWMRFIDESLLPRIDYGKGKGVFTTSITMLANSEVVVRKLGNTTTSLFSGATGNKLPLSYSKKVQPEQKVALLNMQVPEGKYAQEISKDEMMARMTLSQFTNTKQSFLANWLTVKELGIVAGLPQKEVVGLSLNEEVEFGLNCPQITDAHNAIPLGSLVRSGVVQDGIKVELDRRNLSKHIFVCGVTGSGKTTTCMGLLKNSNMPFLVIEPAKTEYRILANSEKDVLVFTLGKDAVAPFRLNPLEFLPGETISSHVDILMASITAAFDMEAAIPQVIESSLYECYKSYGWDVNTSRNSRFEDPFAPGVFSFPTLSDLIKITERIVDKQGFSDRLKGDYLGSVKARLQGLVVGAKGAMLDTHRSVDFRTLIKRKVIIELENVKSVSEKSLIMGFILSSLNEAIKSEFSQNHNFKHITLVEEAHRLLAKYAPGDSLNKKNGVEMFADMLAEIRKYGECLIIADQIPDKMTPEVLKNTNTKIVHKIFAQDDKDAIGNTMSLSQEQKSFLSNLSIGRAVVFSQGWDKSIQTQVDLVYDTTNEHIEEWKLRDVILKYYAETYQSGVFPELSLLDKQPSEQFVQNILENVNFKQLAEEFRSVLNSKKNDYRMNPSALKALLEKYVKYYSINTIGMYLNQVCFGEPDKESENLVVRYLSEIQSGSIQDDEDAFLTNYNLLFKLKSKK